MKSFSKPTHRQIHRTELIWISPIERLCIYGTSHASVGRRKPFSFKSAVKMAARRQMRAGHESNTGRHAEKARVYQYDTCKQGQPLCVYVLCFSCSIGSESAAWGHRLSSRAASIPPLLIFSKQLMEAFRAGKLIKIICRSSSFKDSPLVCVELNHAWLENPSIGHCNWLVLLMAFQCSHISGMDGVPLAEFTPPLSQFECGICTEYCLSRDRTDIRWCRVQVVFIPSHCTSCGCRPASTALPAPP